MLDTNAQRSTPEHHLIFGPGSWISAESSLYMYSNQWVTEDHAYLRGAEEGENKAKTKLNVGFPLRLCRHCLIDRDRNESNIYNICFSNMVCSLHGE